MFIRWHGHACFEISNGTTIVTDPHDGKSIGIKPPDVTGDIVLQSHDHFDHNCARLVRGSDVKVITTSEARQEKGIKILGVDTFHDEVKGEKRGPNIIFKFGMDDLNICHLGDLGELLNEEQIKAIGDVDILFCPVGGTFTLDAEGAWQVINNIKPKIIVPMHYRVGGLSLSIAPIDGFLDRASGQELVKVGNEIEFTKDDIPEEQEIWMFSL
ncbi:MAG: MBL fold metallo-hydrolase [Thermoplasmata archaeon]|nr:MBL fold metallo-hydrolase [Thermoplasmata archaeon]